MSFKLLTQKNSIKSKSTSLRQINHILVSSSWTHICCCCSLFVVCRVMVYIVLFRCFCSSVYDMHPQMLVKVSHLEKRQHWSENLLYTSTWQLMMVWVGAVIHYYKMSSWIKNAFSCWNVITHQKQIWKLNDIRTDSIINWLKGMTINHTESQ